MFKFNAKIGSVPVQMECKDIKEVFQHFELIHQLPTSCVCGETNILPAFQKNKDGDEFYFLKCMNQKCGKEFKLGKRKSDNQLFPKEWANAFHGGSREAESSHDESSSGEPSAY